MATDQNDRLLRAMLEELRGLRTDVRALAAPTTVNITPAKETLDLREPAVRAALLAEPEPEPAPKPAKKAASPTRRKR